MLQSGGFQVKHTYGAVQNVMYHMQVRVHTLTSKQSPNIMQALISTPKYLLNHDLQVSPLKLVY